MAALLMIAYILVGGQWRVDEAVQSAPTQAMHCDDEAARLRTRVASEPRVPDRKVEIFCQRIAPEA